jgi:RHS repeat-associated protein
MIDDTAAVVNNYTYDPFGEDMPAERTETVSNPFKFTGQWGACPVMPLNGDTETQQYYLRARQYTPAMKRFTTHDPVKGEFTEPLTLHAYLYCMNDPINYLDPQGLFRFGHRALGGSLLAKYIFRYIKALPADEIQPIFLALNRMNLEISHEQGFFEDGSQQNVGFFGPLEDPVTGRRDLWQGLLLQDNSVAEDPSQYAISAWQYDDSIMRQAINNVNTSGNFDPQDYKLGGRGQNNCQDYATALRKEYEKLGGKVKYRPFKRTSKF